MKRGSCSKEDFLKAVSELRNGSTSSEVAAKYHIPSSTLRHHKLNPSLKIGGGRPTILSKDQEHYLVELLKNLEVNGIRLTKSMVLKLASEYIELVAGKIHELGRKWFQNFLQRWKGELKVVREEKIESYRRNGFTEEVRCGWFEMLGRILQTNNLISRPHAIFNCDESGFSDETACELVVVSHETKHTYEQSGGSGKNFTTSLMCSSAAGEILPPFIIYSAKTLNPQWTKGGPPGTKFAVSDSGWITKSLFSQWFIWFVEYTKDVAKPILLIMDNHACHISIEVIETAKANQILLLLLPPSCTHALQPLDTVTFSSAKQSWKRIVSKYFLRSGRKTIRKIDLPSLFNQLYLSSFTPKQVVAGFSRAGVWPFDPNAMKEKVARQPLTTNLLNRPPSPSSNTITVTTSPALRTTSSFSSHLNKSNVSSVALDSNRVNGTESNSVSNQHHSMPPVATLPTTNSLSSGNLDLSSSFGPIIGTTEPYNTSRNSNASITSLLNPFDLLSFPSFNPNESFNSNLFNSFDDQFKEFDKSILPIDTNVSVKKVCEPSGCVSQVLRDATNCTEDKDGQLIIAYDPRTLPEVHDRYFRSSNELNQPMASTVDIEEETTRTYTELTTFNVQNLTQPSTNTHNNSLIFEVQSISSAPPLQLSPSSAVRSIFTDILQQHVHFSSASSNTKKQKRTEGKYGEEITSSNKLNELKEKSATPKSRKRAVKLTQQKNSTSVIDGDDNLETTTRKKRRISKRTEFITVSQATRAITTLQTMTTRHETSDENNIVFPAHRPQ